LFGKSRNVVDFEQIADPTPRHGDEAIDLSSANSNYPRIGSEEIRREAERCDSLEGFAVFNAMGGKIGSSFACSVAEQNIPAIKDRNVKFFSLWPDLDFAKESGSKPRVGGSMEAYNFMVSLGLLKDY